MVAVEVAEQAQPFSETQAGADLGLNVRHDKNKNNQNNTNNFTKSTQNKTQTWLRRNQRQCQCQCQSQAAETTMLLIQRQTCQAWNTWRSRRKEKERHTIERCVICSLPIPLLKQ